LWIAIEADNPDMLGDTFGDRDASEAIDQFLTKTPDMFTNIDSLAFFQRGAACGKTDGFGAVSL
jgi:hypothetical protein